MKDINRNLYITEKLAQLSVGMMKVAYPSLPNHTLFHSCFTMSQERLRTHVCRMCSVAKVPFKVMDGNILSINHPGAPVFVAHMDIIRPASLENPLVIYPEKLARHNGTLGADDRAGVYAVLTHMKYINFILTRDEESGTKGARALDTNPEFKSILAKAKCNAFVELDRKSNGDIIGKNNELCNDDLVDVISDALERPYKTAKGSWTDVHVWNKILPSVNLSVGYTSQHSDSEWLDMEHYQWFLTQIIRLNDALKGHGPFTLPEIKVYTPPTGSRYTGGYYGRGYTAPAYHKPKTTTLPSSVPGVATLTKPTPKPEKVDEKEEVSSPKKEPYWKDYYDDYGLELIEEEEEELEDSTVSRCYGCGQYQAVTEIPMINRALCDGCIEKLYLATSFLMDGM